MEAPKCKFCGVSEWRHVCHGLADTVIRKARPVVAGPVREVRVSTGSRPSGEGKVAKQRWSREAYNAYQREYMKRRRAKAVC